MINVFVNDFVDRFFDRFSLIDFCLTFFVDRFLLIDSEALRAEVPGGTLLNLSRGFDHPHPAFCVPWNRTQLETPARTSAMCIVPCLTNRSIVWSFGWHRLPSSDCLRRPSTAIGRHSPVPRWPRGVARTSPRSVLRIDRREQFVVPIRLTIFD